MLKKGLSSIILASVVCIGMTHALAAETVFPPSGTGKPVSELSVQAENGDIRAQLALAIAYYYGRGVAQDNEKAAFWAKKAAEKGSADAQYALGTLYYHGKGVTQNRPQAEYWYRKAAMQKHPAGIFLQKKTFPQKGKVKKSYTKRRRERTLCRDF